MTSNNKFNIDYTVFEDKYKRKNISFFNLLGSGRFSKAYLVEDESDSSKSKISLITIKKGKPMSMPLDLFEKAVVSKDERELILSGLEKVSKKEFNKLIKHNMIETETHEFWKRFRRTDKVASIIHQLESGQTLTVSSVADVPESVLRLEESYFYHSVLKCYKSIGGRCKCEDHNTYVERLVPPSEALGLISEYLIRKSDMNDENFKEYILDTYVGGAF